MIPVSLALLCIPLALWGAEWLVTARLYRRARVALASRIAPIATPVVTVIDPRIR